MLKKLQKCLLDISSYQITLELSVCHILVQLSTTYEFCIFKLVTTRRQRRQLLMYFKQDAK